MAETPHKEPGGENRDLQTIGLVRAENGGGREAKEESVEGRMVETGVGGSDQEAGCGEQRGRQNGMENQKSLKAHVRFQGKPFNITVVQVYAPTSNAEEAEVEWFYEDLKTF